MSTDHYRNYVVAGFDAHMSFQEYFDYVAGADGNGNGAVERVKAPPARRTSENEESSMNDVFYADERSLSYAALRIEVDDADGDTWSSLSIQRHNKPETLTRMHESDWRWLRQRCDQALAQMERLQSQNRGAA